MKKSWHKGRHEGDWMSEDLVDAFGREIKAGDKVARACTSGRAVNLEFATVREIKNGKVYLDISKVPINYPGRLLVINEIWPKDDGDTQEKG